jgi:CHASE2 domain-containing sensor protein
MAMLRSHKVSRKRASARAILAFAIACIVAYGLEQVAHLLISEAEQHAGSSDSVFMFRGGYERLVTAWPRDLVPRFTSLVYIDPDADRTAVSFLNVCDQRAFLAELISAVAERNPAVIVVDKFFTPRYCAPDHPGTLALEKAIADASTRVPVVTGLRINGENASPGPRSIEPPIAFRGALLFGEGIINIDTDSRRLPLGWTIDRDSPKRSEWRNTLALQVAEAYDSRLYEKYPRLERLVTQRANPYISMMPPAAFPAMFTGDLLCTSRNVRAAVRRLCAERVARATDPSYVRGRIVVIGEKSRETDVHNTIIGRVPGFVLQANYIEALLDQRYFEPVPWWINYLLGFLFFAAVKASLHQKSALRCVAGFVGVALLTVLLLSLVVRYLGYFVDPVAGSASVLALLLIVWIFERVLRTGEEHHEKS